MAAILGGHRVVSHILPQDSQYKVLAFSTQIGKKTVLTGIGIGDGPTMTPIANQVVRVLCEYHNKDAKFNIVLCRDKKTAAKRAASVVLGADDGDAVFILCKDSEVYDAVHITKMLGFERCLGSSTLH